MNENIYTMLDELALQAGCHDIQESYREVRGAMQGKPMKQYAVLGDMNSGKSTVINILAGEKRLPASIVSGEHDKMEYVEGDGCRWVELASDLYAGDQLKAVESPLWYMDAAIYLLSATMPFSQQDVNAIKACITHGVPCSLVLSKLDVVDEGEREEIVAYVTAQIRRYFDEDALLVINIKEEDATRQAIMEAFEASEDSDDMRDYILAVSYAKDLKEAVAAKHETVKAQMQEVVKREKRAQQERFDENLLWDTVDLELETKKRKLVEQMSLEMNQLYAECISNLTEMAVQAPSPKTWWEESLNKEFQKEMVRISEQIDRFVCSRFAADRDWLIQTVQERFGTQMPVEAQTSQAKLNNVIFGVAPERLTAARKTKTLAMAGLLASTVVLSGVLIYPIVAMHSINAICWQLAGAAVVGTGFWTFMETKKDREEKQQCLRSEIARYVLGNRDDNISVLKKNIGYGYEEMKLAVQDFQLSIATPKANAGDSAVHAEFKKMAELNRKCGEAVDSLVN